MRQTVARITEAYLVQTRYKKSNTKRIHVHMILNSYTTYLDIKSCSGSHLKYINITSFKSTEMY